jgi:hypothetical protein
MGALLVDAILQAGLNYRIVVAPRVESVLSRFPEARTTVAFRRVLLRHSPAGVLQWHHHEKPRRLWELTTHLVENCVFTKNALTTWLTHHSNLTGLTSIPGIGPKTVDYMKQLCGIDAIAVDRHIRRFVTRAGVSTTSYSATKLIVEHAADLLEVPRSVLDRAIWEFESGNQ